MTPYRRVVLKLSGESLGGSTALDSHLLRDAVKDLMEIHELGVSLTVVVGGGNLFRGNVAHLYGLPPDKADEIGMTCTGINAMVLAGMLADLDVRAQVFSRGPCIGFGQPYRASDVRDVLDLGTIAILAGGMGVPGISTDVAAVAAASDMAADAVVMSKFGTDGVYSSDPRRSKNPRFLSCLTASYALEKQLAVMDRKALECAIERSVRVHVVPAAIRSAARQVIEGQEIGSTILPR
jgi:uridylate kinase